MYIQRRAQPLSLSQNGTTVAKTNILKKGKFKLLQRDIRRNWRETLGTLEGLWMIAHEGTPIFPDIEHVEAALDWDGDPGALGHALIARGWLDMGHDGSLGCHNYWQECPNYVADREAKRMNVSYAVIRKLEVFNEHNGIKKVAIPDKKPDFLETHSKLLERSDGIGSYQTKPNQTHNQEIGANAPSEKDSAVAVSKKQKQAYPEDFVAFWSQYPANRRVEKPNAFSQWKKASREGRLPELDTLLASLKLQCASDKWREKGGQFVPYPAKWIKLDGWENTPQNFTPTTPKGHYVDDTDAAQF